MPRLIRVFLWSPPSAAPAVVGAGASSATRPWRTCAAGSADDEAPR